MASFTDPAPEAPSAFPAGMLWRVELEALLRRLRRRRVVATVAVALPVLGLAFVRFGASGRFVLAAVFLGSLSLLSVIDIAERRLPNRIVLPAFVTVLAGQTMLFPDRALEWVLASVGASLALLLLHLAYPRGLGLGDVKLALLLGAGLGGAVLTGLLVGTFAAAAFALLLLVRSRGAARHTAMPFGPFLAFGALVALLGGTP
ncbi:MAG TPA: A24 family peptidase [Gaiellaceae bacterium]|nr:A24 family peptidase [Gaiellaceae bacterium]